METSLFDNIAGVIMAIIIGLVFFAVFADSLGVLWVAK